MKILHTGDWHIGKIINDFSMLEDQKHIINEFFKVIEQKNPDLIMITGDIYDRSIPPKEAVEFLDETLTKLIEDYQIPTLIVAGNHDSQERLSFASKLLEHKQLYIEGLMKETIKKITFEDGFGKINFYLVPYAHPSVIRELYKDDQITNHHKAFEALVGKIKEDFNIDERNILITHNYIISSLEDALMSDSERSLSIGGTDYVEVSLVEDFDYVALGHLHNNQKVKQDHIRYSGSPLKYSFSESQHRKGVILVDLCEKGKCFCEFIPLEPLRDMRMIEGQLEELIKPTFYNQANRYDYIYAKLTDTTDLYDPISKLRSVYPNIMQLERNSLITSIESSTKAKGNFKELSKLALFKEFYHNMTSRDLDDSREKILVDLLEDVEKEEMEG